MITAIRFWMVLLGIAAGGLITTVLALVLWLLLELLSAPDPPLLALYLGTIGGMLGAGWFA